MAAKKKVYAAERPYRQSVILLVVGDIMCFLIFSIVGDASHNEFSGLTAVPHIIAITLPFLAGWFLVAPFFGLFRKEMTTAPRAMAYRTAFAWIPAWIIAMLLRGLFIDHAVPGSAFMSIAFVFNLAVLELWRWPFALNNLARKQSVK
ncbi:MAG TPA: DUF3054 domain-containing protein [Chthonomonadales bacterium]|nr:DUF3054 domain-containing protein [Chthonomonadales bacterium]